MLHNESLLIQTYYETLATDLYDKTMNYLLHEMLPMNQVKKYSGNLPTELPHIFLTTNTNDVTYYISLQSPAIITTY